LPVAFNLNDQQISTAAKKNSSSPVFDQTGSTTDCSRNAVSVVRIAAQPYDCECGDDVQFGFGHRKRHSATARRTVGDMYTGKVVRLRSFAGVLALVLTASPVIRLVCLMDCDRAPTTSACHKSANAPSGSNVGDGQHPCGHDHSLGSPALLASAGTRDSSRTVAPLPLTTVAVVSIAGGGVAIRTTHGPPGMSRRTSSTVAILRI
jgi:hypothetical protein